MTSNITAGLPDRVIGVAVPLILTCKWHEPHSGKLVSFLLYNILIRSGLHFRATSLISMASSVSLL